MGKNQHHTVHVHVLQQFVFQPLIQSNYISMVSYPRYFFSRYKCPDLPAFGFDVFGSGCSFFLIRCFSRPFPLLRYENEIKIYINKSSNNHSLNKHTYYIIKSTYRKVGVLPIQIHVVYCSLTFQALALRQREVCFSLTKGQCSKHQTILSVLAVHRPFHIYICISTLPTQHTKFNI